LYAEVNIRDFGIVSDQHLDFAETLGKERYWGIVVKPARALLM
jgi:hypothetical protein